MRGVVVGVKQWQRDHGLTDDGVWGPKSRAAAGDGDTERPEPVDPPSPVADALTVADRMRRDASTLRGVADGLEAGADRLRRAAGHTD